jgi:serine/threonine-protein kinase
MATINAVEMTQESSEDISTISTYKEMEIPERTEESEETEDEGLRIGPYTVLKLVNEGGMGKIFLGKKDNSPMLYAIKVMSDTFSNTQKKLESFRREAKVAMMLNHPNIVRVYEFSEKENMAYIAMEHVDGADLATVIHRLGRLEFREAIKIIRQVAMALEYAHQKGIVHRDIKPANILITRKWQAKLLDFGLNRMMDSDNDKENKESQAGRVLKTSLGTPNFMAPEQIIDADTVDGRADLYSLGATFYNCLTGKAPWEGRPQAEIMENQVKKSLPPLSKEITSLPPSINNLFAKLMAKKVDKRYKSAREFLVDLLEMEMSGSQG